MQIKNNQKINALDESLNLFEEDKWSFFDVIDEKGENYEYFGDITDEDVSITTGKLANSVNRGILGAFAIACIALVITIVSNVNKWVAKSNISYEAVAQLATSEDKVVTKRKEGVEVPSEDVVYVSRVLNTYSSIMHSNINLDALNSCCKNEESMFYKNYATLRDKIEFSYDENDSKLRAIMLFANTYNIVRVNQVIYSDGKYYCYATVTRPTEKDIQDYVYLYNYNIIKYFTSHDIDAENVLKFLADNIADNPIPNSVEEVCFEFEKEDDVLVMTNDGLIYDTCELSYQSAINKIVKAIQSAQ